MQAIAEQGRIVRLPLNVVGNLNKMNKAFWKLEQEYSCEPTNEQLAEILELSVNKIKIMNENNRRSLSLDKPFDGENPGEWNLLDVLESENFNTPDANLILDACKKDIARVLDTLKPREKGVLQYFYWLHSDYPQWLTLEEIGEKFELTRERVRQIKEKAIKRLRHTSRSEQLKQYLER